jgi:ubiquinone/menaquinone biosynthesis C-methylase UbiE
MSQDNVFLKSEGDNWFKRNANSLVGTHDKDFVIDLIQLYNIVPKNVLEIGASNGWRLNEINGIYGCNCVAVEPSELAINAGKEKYPIIEFHRAVANELPFDKDQKFDLVIINFVFHWIGREQLFKSVSEIDRVLSDGGFLVIGDFMPDSPNKVNYYHIKDQQIWTYKQDYARLFTCSNVYKLIGSITGHHETKKFDPYVDNKSRIAVTLLKKDYDNYPEQNLD